MIMLDSELDGVELTDVPPYCLVFLVGASFGLAVVERCVLLQ